MDSARPGIFVVDTRGVIRQWDERAAELLGYSASEVVGESMELLIVESYRERHWNGFNAAIARGATKNDQPAINVPLRRRDGKVALHPAREILLRDAFGASAGVLVVLSPACVEGEDNGLPSIYLDALEP